MLRELERKFYRNEKTIIAFSVILTLPFTSCTAANKPPVYSSIADRYASDSTNNRMGFNLAPFFGSPKIEIFTIFENRKYSSANYKKLFTS